jgi:hypothetical protein
MYFLFNCLLYDTRHGVATRSPLTYVTANFYTVFFGEQAISVMVKRLAYLYIHTDYISAGQTEWKSLSNIDPNNVHFGS